MRLYHGWMELPIQYATARDGVRIAYAVVGSGPPIVRMPTPVFSHIQLEWRESVLFERMAERCTVIPFDPRGTGLSDREPEDLSLEARVLDLEAVADRIPYERFVLHAVGWSGPMAVTYALAHPDRVSRLILDGTVARNRRVTQTPQNRAFVTLSEDWEAMTENLAFAIFGLGGEDAKRVGAFFRACVEPHMAGRIIRALDEDDATDLLPLVRCPTLVLQHTGLHDSPAEFGREIASAIPDARLVLLGGRHNDDTDVLLRNIVEFVGAEPLAPRAAAAAAPGTAVILFTDIADSTALTERLGDAAFRTASRELDERLRIAMRESGGTPVDGVVLGDGVMGVFRSAAQAIDAARRCIALGVQSALPIHVGLHAGDVISEGASVYGGAVNIASRICALSAPGEALVSGTVRDLGRTSGGARFDDRGEQTLRGIEDLVRVFAVRWEESDG